MKQLQPEPTAEDDVVRVSAWLGVLWRRKWIIILVIVAFTASAYFLSARQPKQYEASADLIYEKQLDIANPLTGQAYTDPTQQTMEINSVGRVLASPDMVKRARKGMGAGAVEPYSISAAAVNDTGTVGAASNVVRITATSGDPELSAAAANAYAKAFVDWRTERVQTQIERALDATRNEIASYHGASKNSTDYVVLQQRLQDLKILQATSTGNFRVLVPATTPEAPVSPRPLRNAVLGLFFGIVVALVAAFLMDFVDRRVRDDVDVAQILRQPILARIPRISRRLLDDTALVTLAEPGGATAEAFRLLRSNLSFMNVDGEIKSIMLSSCLQGEGKSVTLANLAISLAISGKRVVVVDADLRRPRVHRYFGVSNDLGVSTVTTGQSDLAESLQAVSLNGVAVGGHGHQASGLPAAAELRVLTSGPVTPNPGEIVSSRALGAVLKALEPAADIVLVDSPAMLAVGDTAALADKVDALMFLVEPDVVRRQTLARAREQLDKLPCRMLGIVIARRKDDTRYAPSYYYREDDSGNRTRVGKAKSERAARSV